MVFILGVKFCVVMILLLVRYNYFGYVIYLFCWGLMFLFLEWE